MVNNRASSSSLRSVLPATIDGYAPVVLEAATGIIASYVRDANAPASKTNPVTTLTIMAPSPGHRELGFVAGWHKPNASDHANDIVDLEYRGHRAQLVRSRSDCGATLLGRPVEATKCMTQIMLAVRLTHDRVLIIDKRPTSTDKEVFALADTLDLSAIDAAAQRTVMSED